MLKILRKHSKHWVIGLIIGAIVVVFIFWGIGSRKAAQSQELAEVYGEPIPMATYYQYASLLEKKARFRRNLTDEDYKALREGAQDSLIRLVLLNKAADRMGLTVSDAEVQAGIIRDPAFQHDGAFDPRLYEYFIGRGRNREAEKVAYEKWLRMQLLAAKALDTIASFAKVSELELQEYFRLAREAVQVDYLVVNPESFVARAKPTDAELKEYYQKHEPEFRVPEKTKVRYLLIRSQDFLKKVEVSSKEIEDYLGDHRSELPEAEAKSLALEKIKEEKSRELARDEAKRLQAEATTTSFQEMAKKSKLTPQETPFITLTEPIPGLGAVRAFNKEAFSLKAKEVGLAEVPGGFAVLQDLERKAAYLPTFEEAKDKVRQAVTRQEAQQMAEKEAGQLLTRLRQGEPLAKVAAQAALPLKDSGYFTRLQGFMQQPLAEPLTSAAFLLSDKQPYPDKPVTWQGKYYLLAFKKRRLPTPEEFQKDRENLEQRVLEDKRQVLLDAWFREEWHRARVSKPRQS
jgi:peptidyl-prolyl cis-trans isomerase D